MADEKLQHAANTPPLNIEDGAVIGVIVEEDAQAYLEALRYDLAMTLRAVLAERLVNDPEEEIRQADVVRDVRLLIEPEPRPPVSRGNNQK